jgi:hypothetical protein
MTVNNSLHLHGHLVFLIRYFTVHTMITVVQCLQ